jgi:hypothetical protein
LRVAPLQALDLSVTVSTLAGSLLLAVRHQPVPFALHAGRVLSEALQALHALQARCMIRSVTSAVPIRTRILASIRPPIGSVAWDSAQFSFDAPVLTIFGLTNVASTSTASLTMLGKATVTAVYPAVTAV